MKKPQIDAEKKKKWDNFWYYYKYHVLAGAFILFCIIIFVKDMRGKVSYDYTVAFLGEYGIAQEDSTKLQKWFEEHAEDLNGDGEVHMQIADYSMPSDDSETVDPHMVMASQTKLTVDMQEGTSMIYFVSQGNYDKFKDMGVFPEDWETYKKAEDCSGYQEAGSPVSIKGTGITMRIVGEIEDQKTRESWEKYYDASEKLMNAFTGE